MKFAKDDRNKRRYPRRRGRAQNGRELFTWSVTYDAEGRPGLWTTNHVSFYVNGHVVFIPSAGWKNES